MNMEENTLGYEDLSDDDDEDEVIMSAEDINSNEPQPDDEDEATINAEDTNSNEITVENGKLKASAEVIDRLRKCINSKSFIDVWKNLKPSLEPVCDSAMNNSDKADDFRSIGEILAESLKGSVQELQFDELTIKENEDLNTLLENVIEFLCCTSVLSLLNCFETDRNMKLQSFGFSDFASTLSTAITMKFGVSQEEAKSKFLRGILSNMRSADECEHINDYLITASHVRDISLISHLIDLRETNRYNENLSNCIKNSMELATIMKGAVASVMGEYDALFQDGTGVKPYYGVLTFTDTGNCSYTLTDHTENSIENITSEPIYDDTFKRYILALKTKGYDFNSDINISQKRQFDEVEILESDKPVYFPKKILEFAKCAKCTGNITAGVYDTADLRGGYLKSEFRKGMERTVEQVVKNGLMYVIKDISDNLQKNFEVAENIDALKKAVDKIKQSLSVAFLITELKASTEGIYTTLASVKLRFCDIYSRFTGTNEETRLILNVEEEYSTDTPVDCTKGIYLEGKRNTNPAYKVWEFGFMRDFEAATKEPLFSYTVVKQLLDRNINLSWDNALIGELETGRILFSNPKEIGSGFINLQGTVVHNMFAGSRVGKGVQTMSQLGNTTAEGRPIFYIDRKPDMGAMFAELTHGNMFIVNGGQQQFDKDYLRTLCYADNGATDEWHENGEPKLLKGWNDRLPKSLYDTLCGKVPDNADYLTYYDSPSLGDLVYLRAVLFCLCLICLRTKQKANKEVYENLGGSYGITIVIDEFSNWHDFERSIFSSVLITKYIVSVKDYQEVETALRSEKTMKRGQEMRDTIGKTGKPYMTDLLSCMDSIYKTLGEITRAGFIGTEKGSEVSITDIYLIGQNTSAMSYSTPALFNDGKTTSPMGRNINKIPTTDCPDESVIRKMLSNFTQDWFLGRQWMGADKWVDKESTDPEIYRKLENRYWLYSTSAHSIISKGDIRNMSYEVMKPYLVLNNNCEPDFDAEANMTSNEKPPECQYVRNCVGEGGKTMGVKLWKSVRTKHTVTPQTADNPQWGTLHEGIGFAGLVKMMMKSGGKFTGENDYLTVLAKSSDIANYVAMKLGYNNWREFIFDFTPTGLFSYEDLESALINPNYSFMAEENVKKRAKHCDFFGCLYPELVKGNNYSGNTAEEQINADDEFDVRNYQGSAVSYSDTSESVSDEFDVNRYQQNLNGAESPYNSSEGNFENRKNLFIEQLRLAVEDEKRNAVERINRIVTEYMNDYINKSPELQEDEEAQAGFRLYCQDLINKTIQESNEELDRQYEEYLKYGEQIGYALPDEQGV